MGLARVCLAAVIFSLCTYIYCDDAIVLSEVKRVIDLTTHLVKISHQISFDNNNAPNINFYLGKEEADHLSFIGASIKGSDQKLSIKEGAKDTRGLQTYLINLPGSLGSQTVHLNVELIFTHLLKPYPTQITQAEKQFVQYKGGRYFLSTYKVKKQTTTVNCALGKVESYTKEKGVAASENTINYGPYHDKIGTESAMPLLEVHFENNSPFLTATNLLRVIEVSHWGNIAVEETVDLSHSGALLKGPFSRLDYQRNQDGISSIKSFKMQLPAAARDIYYRDEIGNISTSNVREMVDSVEVEIRPRFPLFGGWKTHHVIGYNIPSYQYLYNKGEKYALKMPFLDHVYDDQVVDMLTVKVILPEGAHNTKLLPPYKVAMGKSEIVYTYLDTFGRPVIVAHKTNLVESHIQDFELVYSFRKYYLLQEPLLVVTAFYLLFLAIIIYVRMDFAITKDQASEMKMRIASLVEQVQGDQDRRSALYQSYEDAINKFKSSKDTNAFASARKKIDTDHRKLSNQIDGYMSKLKSENTETADKVAELQKLDGNVRDQLTGMQSLAERLVSMKITRPAYLDQEAKAREKRDDICQKIESMLASL